MAPVETKRVVRLMATVCGSASVTPVGSVRREPAHQQRARVDDSIKTDKDGGLASGWSPQLGGSSRRVGEARLQSKARLRHCMTCAAGSTFSR